MYNVHIKVNKTKYLFFSIFAGRQNVYNNCFNICYLLVTLPPIFCLFLPQQRHNTIELCSTSLSWFLLAGHV